VIVQVPSVNATTCVEPMGIEHTSKVCDAKEMGASLVDVAVNALESVFSMSPGLVNVIVAVIG
jgi:hypothetical protein